MDYDQHYGDQGCQFNVNAYESIEENGTTSVFRSVFGLPYMFWILIFFIKFYIGVLIFNGLAKQAKKCT